MFKNKFLFLSLLLAISCVSTEKKDPWADVKDKTLKDSIRKSTSLCMSQKNPQLLAYFKAGNYAQQTIEMIWNAPLKEMQANILSPIGDVVLSIQIKEQDDGDVDVFSSGMESTQSYFKQIKDLFKVSGVKNLRRIFCGEHLFLDKITVQRKELSVRQHSISLQEKKGTIAIESKSSADIEGIFGGKVADVLWKADVTLKRSVSPKFLSIELLDSGFTATFQTLEFE